MLLSRLLEPEGHRQHDLPGGIAPRRVRRERHGASARAHELHPAPRTADIKKELTDHGAQFNGTTYYDRTNYFETITASDDNLKWALGLEAERMVNMRIEKKLLDTEMTVVRNEFERGENSPQRILEERVDATAYLWHNYGKSTIGSRADIEKVPIDRLAAFYHKYYQPDNAVLVIAGQFDEAKTLDYVAATCGAIPRPRASSTQPTRWSPCRMANATWNCAASATNRKSWWHGMHPPLASRIRRHWKF